MIEWIIAILLVIGAIFMLLAALGALRFPDVFTRMHAATKASSFGAGLMLIGAVIYFAQLYITIEALLVIIFIFLTAPVASHMIGRAAYFLKVSVWDETIIDELQGRYDFHTHTLSSEPTDHSKAITPNALKPKIRTKD